MWMSWIAWRHGQRTGSGAMYGFVLMADDCAGHHRRIRPDGEPWQTCRVPGRPSGEPLHFWGDLTSTSSNAASLMRAMLCLSRSFRHTASCLQTGRETLTSTAGSAWADTHSTSSLRTSLSRWTASHRQKWCSSASSHECHALQRERFREAPMVCSKRNAWSTPLDVPADWQQFLAPGQRLAQTLF